MNLLCLPTVERISGLRTLLNEITAPHKAVVSEVGRAIAAPTAMARAVAGFSAEIGRGVPDIISKEISNA